MLLPGRRRLPLGARGSAHAVVISQRCAVGRLKEMGPAGAGLAGFPVSLPNPNPNHRRFPPSVAEHNTRNQHLPFRGELSGTKPARGPGQGGRCEGRKGRTTPCCSPVPTGEDGQTDGGSPKPGGLQFSPTHPRPGPSCSAAAPRSPHGAGPVPQRPHRSPHSRRRGDGDRIPGIPDPPPPPTTTPSACPCLVFVELLPLRFQAVPRSAAQHPRRDALDAVHGGPRSAHRAPRTAHRASGAARGSSRPRTAPGPTAPLAAATRLCPAPRGPKRPHAVLHSPTLSHTASRGPLVLASGCWRLVPEHPD